MIAAGNTFIQWKRIHPVREHDPRAIVAKSAWAGEDANIDIDESGGDGVNVAIGAKSGVWSIPANDRYFGNPVFKRKPIWTQVAAVRKRLELIRQWQRLEARVGRGPVPLSGE